MKCLIGILSFLILSVSLPAQPWLSRLPAGKPKNLLTLHDYRKAFNEYWAPFRVENGYYFENGIRKKAAGWKQFRRWEYETENRTDQLNGRLPLRDGVSIVRDHDVDSPSGTTAAWSPVGPVSSGGGYAGVGRLNCIAFHPSDPNTYWVGAASGGLWVTSNHGASWSCLTDANGSLAVSDIIIPPDYAVSHTIYIATGDRDHWDNRSIGVLKSTDGGLSWSPTAIVYTLGEAKMVNRLLLNPSDPQILLAATSTGVWKTFNGGLTWNQCLTTTDFIDMEYKPGDFSTLYGATTDGRMLVSHDAGLTWQESYNDGAGQRIELAVSPANPGRVFALVAADDAGLLGVFRSDNSGDTFMEMFAGATSNLLGWESDGSGSGGQGWYDLSLAVSPVNADVVMLGGINTWRSANGGAGWSLVNHWWGDGVPAAHADKHGLAFRPDGALFECNDGGIYYSPDQGNTWIDKTNGMALSQMYKLGVAATVSGEVITGLQDNGTKLRSGGSWSDVKGGDGMECLIDFTNANIQYGTYVNGQISRTTDHWVTAIDIEPSEAGQGAWVTPYVIDPVNPQVLYAGFADVWKTTNRGASWVKISTMNTAEKIRSMAISPSNPLVLYVADPFTIWKTTNGGNSWSNITGTLPSGNGITSLCVKHDDPATVWVAFGDYNNAKVFESANGGTSWTDISSGLPPIPVYSIVQNRQSTTQVQLYAGTEVGVYLKKGAGNWVSFNSGLPNVKIGELEIGYNANPQNSKLFAATYGRGLWETPVHYSPAAMSYVSSTATHPTTDYIPPASVNSIILRVEVVTNGDLSPLAATSFTFSTGGSTNPMLDISSARLYYTGASALFSTAIPYGSTISAPNGTFTINGSQTLTGGSNFFWLTYDLPVVAKAGDLIDAQCTSIIIGSSRIPTVTAPPGNRIIRILHCSASSVHCDEYISGLIAGSFSNYSGCGSGGYSDHTAMVIHMAPGESLPVTVINGMCYSGDDCGIWVDWNGNGDFTDDAPVTVTDPPCEFHATLTCPAGTMSGQKRMRVRIHYTDEALMPCGTTYYGETEDYTIIVDPPASTVVTGTIAAGQSACYSAQQIIELAGGGSSFLVENGGKANLVAGQRIWFRNGARVSTGGYLHAWIDPVNPWCNPSPDQMIITGEINGIMAEISSLFRIFPNPFSEKFTLLLTDPDLEPMVLVEVYNMQGSCILTRTMKSLSRTEFSLGDKPSGLYLVRVTAGRKAETLKIVKQ